MKWNSETTEKLTKNEKKLIDFIFQNIHQFSSMSIQELSQKTHISQATISRLPKHLGYLNFKDMGTVFGYGCGTPSMTKHSQYPQQTYLLGKSL